MKICIAGVDSLIIYFGDFIEEESSKRVKKAYSYLKNLNLDGIIEIVPSYTSIFIQFDIFKYDYESLKNFLEQNIKFDISDDFEEKIITIDVYYGAEVGFDLQKISQEKSLNIDEIIEIYPPNFKYKFKKEFFYYIIHTILKMQNTYNNKASKNISVALNAKILKSFASNYNEYMSYLCDHEIITKTHNYSSGNSSNKYCFSDFVFLLSEKNHDFEVVNITKIKSSKIFVEKSIKDSPIYYSNKHLLKWFNDKLVIDFERAKKYIDNELLDEDDIYSSTSKRHFWLYQISIIYNKVFRATRNEESDYRLHTPLTNFKKDFKKFITYDGKNLIGYDLKNSIPKRKPTNINSELDINTTSNNLSAVDSLGLYSLKKI